MLLLAILVATVIVISLSYAYDCGYKRGLRDMAQDFEDLCTEIIEKKNGNEDFQESL